MIRYVDIRIAPKLISLPGFMSNYLSTQAFELRKYEASRWASTYVQNRQNLNSAMRTGFMRLFSYIRGNNEGGKKVVKVTTKYIALHSIILDGEKKRNGVLH